MRDEDKTTEQLLEELLALRSRMMPAEGLGLLTERLHLENILYDADFRVREWNPAAEANFGYTRSEIVGEVLLDRILTQTMVDRLREVLRRLHAGDMQAHSVNENRTKDGRIIVCEWFNTPLLDAEGHFAGGMSLAWDVTERKATPCRSPHGPDDVPGLNGLEAAARAIGEDVRFARDCP